MRRPGSPPPPVEYFPPDATPIPYGADEDDLNDLGVIRTALFANFGNIKLAATALGVAPGQLSRVVEASVDLKTDRDAARRMIVDLAEAMRLGAVGCSFSSEAIASCGVFPGATSRAVATNA